MLIWNSTDGWQFSWFVALILAAFVARGLWQYRRRRRRRRSLRQEAGGWYVWIELDGSEARSQEDPTPGWDAQDASDSDGDGGD